VEGGHFRWDVYSWGEGCRVPEIHYLWLLLLLLEMRMIMILVMMEVR